MNKKVVYTSIIGEYDTLIQPPAIDESFDYICFVKKGQCQSRKQGIWSIEEIPYDCTNDKQLSSYTKLQPHVVLSQYDYSLWIDGNVSINDIQLYDTINKKIEEGVIYSGLKHWRSDCAYEDLAEVAFFSKAPIFSLYRTLFFLKCKRFPRHYGLNENNVIFRKHNDQTIMKFDNCWWYLFRKYAKRDQLCHPYCLKKFGIEFDYLVPEDYCARNHHFFTYVKHYKQPTIRQGISRFIYDFKRKANAKLLKYLLKIEI